MILHCSVLIVSVMPQWFLHAVLFCKYWEKPMCANWEEPICQHERICCITGEIDTSCPPLSPHFYSIMQNISTGSWLRWGLRLPLFGSLNECNQPVRRRPKASFPVLWRQQYSLPECSVFSLGSGRGSVWCALCLVFCRVLTPYWLPYHW